MGTPRMRRTALRFGILASMTLVLATTVSAAGGGPFSVRLLGTNELPSADPDGRGHATVWVDLANEEVCFDVTVSHTGTPNRAHIHVGTAAQNGGIVVPLFELIGATADPMNDQLEQTGRASDCVPASATVLEQILANPAGYYVNLHNSRFPGGAVRGQLDD